MHKIHVPCRLIWQHKSFVVHRNDAPASATYAAAQIADISLTHTLLSGLQVQLHYQPVRDNPVCGYACGHQVSEFRPEPASTFHVNSHYDFLTPNYNSVLIISQKLMYSSNSSHILLIMGHIFIPFYLWHHHGKIWYFILSTRVDNVIWEKNPLKNVWKRCGIMFFRTVSHYLSSFNKHVT